jgi:hypothetical protein
MQAAARASDIRNWIAMSSHTLWRSQKEYVWAADKALVFRMSRPVTLSASRTISFNAIRCISSELAVVVLASGEVNGGHHDQRREVPHVGRRGFHRGAIY